VLQETRGDEVVRCALVGIGFTSKHVETPINTSSSASSWLFIHLHGSLFCACKFIILENRTSLRSIDCAQSNLEHKDQELLERNDFLRL
jgi:hypothetical protein